MRQPVLGQSKKAALFASTDSPKSISPNFGSAQPLAGVNILHTFNQQPLIQSNFWNKGTKTRQFCVRVLPDAIISFF
jgi:hypothetical protein